MIERFDPPTGFMESSVDGEFERHEDAERLRVCLREQTAQMQITAQRINEAVNDKLRSLGVAEGISLEGHPCEQNVGTCVRALQCDMDDLAEEHAAMKWLLEHEAHPKLLSRLKSLMDDPPWMNSDETRHLPVRPGPCRTP